MFHPDNFYYTIRENYADPDDNVMWVPNFNGAKDFTQFVAYLDDGKKQQYLFSNIGRKIQTKYIYMYDQEPLYPNFTDQYRTFRFDQEEIKLHDIIKQQSWAELLSSSFGCTINIPIWCHSEYKSPEILELESNLFITCYYWYHAFISRDWFRHYQYNKSLQVYDKSEYAYRFLLYAREHTGTRSYRKQMIDNLYIHKSKILYNWDGKNSVGPEYSAKIVSDDALMSSIHLVAETLFETNKIYLTEKIFKPMVMSQPFIIWGPPGTLECLKRYGFRTFDSIWSEEYDTEFNHDKRMLLLSKLVDDLASMTSDEFKEVFRRCLPIIDHNRKWFFSQNFMDNCWQELHQNFETSFERRQELLSTYPGGQFFYALNKNPRLLELSRYKSVLQQTLPVLDDNLRQKIFDTFGFLKKI